MKKTFWNKLTARGTRGKTRCAAAVLALAMTFSMGAPLALAAQPEESTAAVTETVSAQQETAMPTLQTETPELAAQDPEAPPVQATEAEENSTNQHTPENSVVLTPEEMRMMVDIAKEHGLFIIGDEAYREFVYAGEPLQSLGEFEDAAENLILIDSVSKRFSACGARIGCLISRNKELMAHAMKYAQCRLCVPTIDQVASAALYDVGPAYFAAVRDEYKRRRDTVMRKLKEIPGVVCECPKGAFYAMAALPVDDAEKFQIWLLEHFEDHGDTVMFAPGGGFYATPGKGINEIRIAYVLKQVDLERAMDLLALGIQAYNNR